VFCRPEFVLTLRDWLFLFKQIADAYPFMTMYRVLTTEIKFKEADVNHSGVRIQRNIYICCDIINE